MFYFRNIYLGEIFSSYLCVHNGSNQIVKNVTVKVSMFQDNNNFVLCQSFIFFNVIFLYSFHRQTYKQAHRQFLSLVII